MKNVIFLILGILVTKSAFAVPTDEQFLALTERVNANEATVNTRTTELNNSIDGIETRINGINTRVEGIVARMETLRREIQNTNPIGSIIPFAGANALPNYIECDGAWVSRQDFPELYNIIRENFSTAEQQAAHPDRFKLPDLRGRTMVGMDLRPDSICPLGTCRGRSTVTLNPSNLPAHIHNGTTGSSGNHTHDTTVGAAGNHHHDSKFDKSFLDETGGKVLSEGWGHGRELKYNEESKATNVTGNHTHKVTIDKSGNHEHSFSTTETNPGGQTSQPFSILNPSTTVRFLIKAR